VPPAQPSPLNEAQLDKYRQQLLLLRARLVGDVRDLAAEAFCDNSDGSHGARAPTHMADIASDAFEQELTLDLMARDEQRLQSVDAALSRLGTGHFGVCQRCGHRIPRGRLDVLPDAAYCVHCTD
jgi:DnaK suppressor protein